MRSPSSSLARLRVRPLAETGRRRCRPSSSDGPQHLPGGERERSAECEAG